MSDMFDHLDPRVEARILRSLLSNGAAVAFHADADGFCAAFLSSRLVSKSLPPMFQVFTEDLDLSSLCEWVRERAVDSLVTFDINILSAAGALGRLASQMTGRLRIYDDHIGASTSIPNNVEFVKLLPPKPDSLPNIRPASLFCFEMLRSYCGSRDLEFAEFTAVAAAFGEGVIRHFRHFLPRLDSGLDSLARQIGRGINAYFTDMNIGSEDLTLVGQLIDLAERIASETQPRELLDTLIESSQFATTVLEADRIVSQLVERESSAAARSAPWFEIKGLPVYLVEVKSSRRIVHLVASATRTKLDRGIVISKQTTHSGISLELRRARSLHSPDLAATLLDLNPDWFVSRGGHPMAAGATLLPASTDHALTALRNRLESTIY